jgi:uncharacterized protein
MEELSLKLSAPPSLPDVPRPAAESDRIVPIDVLRGVAVLGILVMNIQSFAMIDKAYFFPTAYGDLQGANYWVWCLSHVLTDQKFMTIFSMLFGAGIVLMTGRQEAAGRSSTAFHYRRMLGLLVIGLAHAYLLWYGDILVPYALCGMVVYWFRRLPPWLLILFGLVALVIPSLVMLAEGWSMPFWPPDNISQIPRRPRQPGPDELAETAAYLGGWLRQFAHRAPTAFELETWIFVVWISWRA